MTGSIIRRARVDSFGRAYAGSQRQVQLYVNRAASDLSEAVAAAIGEGFDPVRIEWRAPLERDRLREPYDSAFLAAVDLGEYAPILRTFWPRSGPRWDALAVASGVDPRPGVILVEAKSYPEEVFGPGMAAKAPSSIATIVESLGWAKGVLGAKRSADWTGRYYQYANRLAHVAFLRHEVGVPTWLVNLCVVGDPRSPTTEYHWRQENARFKLDMGFSPGEVPYTVDLYLPALDVAEWTADRQLPGRTEGQ